MGDGQCARVVLLEETDGVVLGRTVFESNGRKAVHVHMMLYNASPRACVSARVRARVLVKSCSHVTSDAVWGGTAPHHPEGP